MPPQQIIWSEYQKAIFQDINSGSGNTIIMARAGSSKSTVLVEGVKYIPKKKKTIFVAFNKKIAEELDERINKSYIEVKTLHSKGFSTIKNAFGSKVSLDPDKALNLAEQYLITNGYKKFEKNKYNIVASLVRIINLCKGALVDIPSKIDLLIDQFDIDTFDMERDDFVKAVCQILRKCKENKEVVDFTDMIWFPYCFGMQPEQYDMVFIDECFPYNQCIATDNGKIEIGLLFKKFKKNKKLPLVQSYNEIENKFEFNKIVNVWSRGLRPLVEIKCGKRKIRCTKNHKFLTNKGWLPAEQLTPGTLIKTSAPTIKNEYCAVDSVIDLNKYEEVYDIEVENNHNFIVCSNISSKSNTGLIAHNCQDLNPAQINLALSMCKRNGRIIVAMDNYQILYQFTGVDLNTADILQKRLNAKILPLPISYRCPKSVIKLAQEIVPDIQEAPTAKEGTIHKVSEDIFLSFVKPGDFILSRINAPLIYYCMELLRNKIPANIAGRDVGASLAFLIKKSEKNNVKDFLNWLNEWKASEIKRLKEKNRDPILIYDKAGCLENLCKNAKSIDEVLNNIKELFADGDDSNRVILTSIHRSKGLERERVFLLTSTLKKNNDQGEKNIEYVAVTRSKSELFLVV